MKWRKIGQIFNFDQSGFGMDYVGFAQSPQVLVCNELVRIYFSTRQRTPNGKFVSMVQYVEMDRSFTGIQGRSKHTVIQLGKLGTFDEHGIFPFCVFRHAGRVWGYSNGWSRRRSVSVETGIGLAVSEDGGQTFDKFGDGPVLTASLHEPYLVCDPFVRVFGGTFHMWYIYGTSWKVFQPGDEPDRTYVIAHATSSDGVNWVKDGRSIIEQKYPDECQALPTVIQIGSRYHMLFCRRNSFDFRTNPANSYRLGYAYSNDLSEWVRDDANCGIDVSPGGWDSDMMCYPHLFEWDGKVYLLYNGNEFGRYGFGLAQLESDELT